MVIPWNDVRFEILVGLAHGTTSHTNDSGDATKWLTSSQQF